MVADGKFRADLLYRLSVARLLVPPLRERPSDVRALALRLLDRVRRRLGSNVVSVTAAVLQSLEQHDWPGNVRELENVLMRAMALSRGNVLEEVFFSEGHVNPTPTVAQTGFKKLWEAERDHVLAALTHSEWNITHTAELLEISPTTLRKKIADYGLR